MKTHAVYPILIKAFAIFFFSSTFTTSFSATVSQATMIEQGKKIAFNRKTGNCLACHAIEGGSLPGNIGPPLINMRDRYPDKEQLHTQIWDATRYNPNSIMPPFGKHEILSNEELDRVVEFIYSL